MFPTAYSMYTSYMFDKHEVKSHIHNLQQMQAITTALSMYVCM